MINTHNFIITDVCIQAKMFLLTKAMILCSMFTQRLYRLYLKLLNEYIDYNIYI